jgi:hypothetical protein
VATRLLHQHNKSDGSWTVAVAVAPPINSEGYEAIATALPDGKYLFFNRGNDIYWVEGGFIGTLKKEM